MIHRLTVELESENKNWHDVADELANAAVEADNSIQNIQVYKTPEYGSAVRKR